MLIIHAYSVLEPDKTVSDWDSEDLHWFKVKGKHTVAKVQKAYGKKCGVMTSLCQGNQVVSLTSQMQQMNHFKDDIIIFWSKKSDDGDNVSDNNRKPLGPVDAATQNRLPSASQTPVKPNPVKSEPARIHAESVLSAVSPSPFKTPAISRSLSAVFTTPRPLGSGSAQPSTSALKPTPGYNLYADAHRIHYENSQSSPGKPQYSQYCLPLC